MNCEFNGKLPLPGKIRPFGGQPATVIVGSTGPQELDAFQVSTNSKISDTLIRKWEFNEKSKIYLKNLNIYLSSNIQ